MTHKQRYIETLSGRPTERLPLAPITMMFAGDLVGRSYRDYATDYRVLCEGQCAVAETFDTSLVSAISDPCVEAHDFGADVSFPEDAPPAVKEEEALLADKAELGGLRVRSPESGTRMANRLSAVRSLKSAVGDDLMVEGWIEGPCAESADLRGINRLMIDFYDDPSFVAELMDLVVEQGTRFATAQVHAGADVIGIGDAASSLIGPQLYDQFVAERTEKLITAIHGAGALVRLHICGNITPLYPALAGLHADQIDVDSMNRMQAAREAVGPSATLCGNLDPVRLVRDGSADAVARGLEVCLEESGRPYVVGAGCEIPRGTPKENLRAMSQFARRPPM